MTPTEAAKILDSIAERYRDLRALEAFRLAREALQNDPATTMRAILNASGKSTGSIQLVVEEHQEHWIGWVFDGPVVSSKSLTKTLKRLLEKVAKK